MEPQSRVVAAAPPARAAWEIFFECWSAATQHLKSIPPVSPLSSGHAPALRALEAARSRTRLYLKLVTPLTAEERTAEVAELSARLLRWIESDGMDRVALRRALAREDRTV